MTGNNTLERQWRQPSLNGKNSLFVGSDRGGSWAATMFSIMWSCWLVDLDPYRYLVDVFAQLHQGRTDYDQLRPMCPGAGRLVGAGDTGSRGSGAVHYGEGDTTINACGKRSRQ